MLLLLSFFRQSLLFYKLHCPSDRLRRSVVFAIGMFRRQGRQLPAELFVFPFESLDIHILWGSHVSFDVLDCVAGAFWFLVQPHQDLGQRFQDAGLFQIFSKFFLFGTIIAVVPGIAAAARVFSGIRLL